MLGEDEDELDELFDEIDLLDESGVSDPSELEEGDFDGPDGAEEGESDGAEGTSGTDGEVLAQASAEAHIYAKMMSALTTEEQELVREYAREMLE